MKYSISSEELNRRQGLKASRSYRLIDKIRGIMDKSFFGIGLDPIIGLIPNVGDIINVPLAVPYLYFAVAKLKSVPLALAVTFNLILDALVGAIPFLGIVLDFMHKGFQKNHDMIIGFVDGDQQVIEKVNKRAVWMSVLIVVMLIILFVLVKLSVLFLGWLWGVLESFWASFF